jgi:hypothetical protein
MIRQVRIELNYWTIEDITVDYCRSHPPVITGKWKSQWLNVIYIYVCIYLLELFVCLFMYLFIFLPIFFSCGDFAIQTSKNRVWLPNRPYIHLYPKYCRFYAHCITICSLPPNIVFVENSHTFGAFNTCLIWMLDGNFKKSTTYTIFYPDSWIISHYSPL